MTEITFLPEDEAVFKRLKSTGRITHGLRRVMTQQWNKCAMCGQVPSAGRPVFAGYRADGAPLLAGACCAKHLKELATPVYWTGTLNLSVDDDQLLWRYIDFAKFVALLQKGGLYFPSADKLDDRFEGAVGLARREQEWDSFYLDFFRMAVKTPPSGFSLPERTVDEIENDAKRLLNQFKGGSSEARKMLVSCWHASGVESEALWRLYCPPPTSGIAVQTTVGRLWDATTQDKTAVVGRVHYLNFRQAFAPIGVDRIFCKRLSLSHENEIRVVLQNERESPVEGKILACDLNALIQKVVVSPFSPPWFAEVVSGVVSSLGFAFDTHRSELLDDPFY